MQETNIYNIDTVILCELRLPPLKIREILGHGKDGKHEMLLLGCALGGHRVNDQNVFTKTGHSSVLAREMPHQLPGFLSDKLGILSFVSNMLQLSCRHFFSCAFMSPLGHAMMTEKQSSQACNAKTGLLTTKAGYASAKVWSKNAVIASVKENNTLKNNQEWR